MIKELEEASHREPPPRGGREPSARPKAAPARRSSAGASPGSAALFMEPWIALGISRRRWYAHRGRYRDRASP
jgi:hypothetical protein